MKSFSIFVSVLVTMAIGFSVWNDCVGCDHDANNNRGYLYECQSKYKHLYRFERRSDFHKCPSSLDDAPMRFVKVVDHQSVATNVDAMALITYQYQVTCNGNALTGIVMAASEAQARTAIMAKHPGCTIDVVAVKSAHLVEVESAAGSGD